jgi:glycosyltransferase involved in cell wall biosynthesis
MGKDSRPAPLVSVIIPSFNEAAAVIRASLGSIVGQTFEDFECIVVDDSTDCELAAVCREICTEDTRFVYVRPEKRLGLSGSLNLALATARGKWVARFDADDICLPTRLALQVQYLEDHPKVDVLGGGMEVIDSEGSFVASRHYPEAHDEIERSIHFSTPIAHPTVMFRRQVVLGSGGYDSSLRFAEDLDLWLRLINSGATFANLKDELIRYRQNCVRREFRHWSANLSVRLKNFSLRFLPRRVAGMIMILGWCALPGRIQEAVYTVLIFRRGGAAATRKRRIV